MSKGPPPNIMERYDQKTMRDNPKSCHYDNLREHGFSPDKARRIAEQAADKQNRTLDNQGRTSKTRASILRKPDEPATEPIHCSVVIPSAWRDE